MNYRVVEINQNSYVEILPGEALIASEQDALDWIAICGEHLIPNLMLHANNLTEDFFHLSTGVAGAILLKFANYRIRVAAVLSPELVKQGKFQDMVIETNRGNQFRVFYQKEKAEEWLTQP